MAAKTDLETLVLRIEANTAQYQKQMKRLVGQQASNTRKIIKSNKDVASSFQRTAQSIAVLHGPLGGVASRFSSMATLVRGSGLALAGFAVAASAVALGVKQMITKFAKAEVQFKTTEGLLKATGFAAGKTAHQIKMLSRDIGLATLASTSEVREAANILLTFRTISGKTFDRTLRAAQDMVASGFGNIKTNAVQLGKALESPREGLTALKRIGVDFSESQKELIRKLADTGQRLKAQQLILAGVERQMKGAGVAAAKSLAGEMDTLGESSQFLFEHWGGLIVRGTGLAKVINKLASEVKAMNDNAPEAIIKRQQAAIDRIRAKNKRSSSIGQGIANIFAYIDGDEKNIQRRLKIIEDARAKIKQMREEEAAALAKSKQAQEEMANAQREAVVSNLREMIRKKKLTEEQLMTEQQLAKAGVDGKSTEAQQIRELVAQYMKLTEIKKESAKATKKAQKEAIKALSDEMKAAKRQAEFFGQAIHTALSDIIFEGKSAGEVIRNLGKTIASAALQRVLVGTGPLGGAGSGSAGILTSLFSGIKLFSKGGAFNRGAVHAFADGGVVNKPTAFSMRNGMGVMGERGPEAIMPLTRGSDGSLGVRMHGSGGVVINFHVQAQDAQSFMKSEGQIASMVSRAVSRGQRNL